MAKVAVELVGIDAHGGARQGYALACGLEPAQALRATHRLVGVAEGGDERAPHALRLSLEELAVGLARDLLELKPAPKDSAVALEWAASFARELVNATRGEECGSERILAATQRNRIRVFYDLWERGYFVTFGSKFGADFLIYSQDPARTHAVALVVVKPFEAPFPCVDLASLGRVAKMVKKQLYFASVRPNAATLRSDVVFVMLTHALLASRQEEEEEEDAGEEGAQHGA